MKSRYNPILAVIILISLCCSLWLAYSRHQVETANKTVEQVLDYQAVKRLAAWEGVSEKQLLNQFKEAGITTLAVYDTTLERLSKAGVIKAITGPELRAVATLQGNSGVFAPLLEAGSITNEAVYIAEGSSPTAFSEVIEDLRLRYGDNRVAVVASAPQIIQVKGDPRVLAGIDYANKTPLMQAPLGLSSEEMREIKKAGFMVAIRPQNYLPVTRTAIESIFARIAASGAKVTSYIPCGVEIVGYPHNEYYMSRMLHDYDMRLGLVEHVTQLQFAKFAGLYDQLEEANYDAVRVYNIDQLENMKLTMPEALRRWALSDEERNIRINYIRLFMKPQNGQDIIDLNLNYVRSITNNVKARGFELGQAKAFQQQGPNLGNNSFAGPYFPSKPALVLVAFGIMAGLAMYLGLLLDLTRRQQVIFTVVAAAIAGLLICVSRGLLTRQALAFIAATIYPTLSMSFMMDIWDETKERVQGLGAILWAATWQLALAVLISLIGATFLGTILGDVRFFLEADIYRGVKFTFVLPIILTCLLFIKRYEVFSAGMATKEGLLKQLLKLKSIKLTMGHVIILGVLGIIALIFVGRSGHSAGVPVPAFEIKLRVFLEQVMYARPREKEFLVGHPAFYLAAFAAYNRAPRLWQLALVAAAVIGQGSLVQTFCHMRTPIMMSYIRAVDGYALGAVLGIIGVVVVALLLPYISAWRRRFLEDE